jgi:hypothetical protein
MRASASSVTGVGFLVGDRAISARRRPDEQDPVGATARRRSPAGRGAGHPCGAAGRCRSGTGRRRRGARPAPPTGPAAVRRRDMPRFCGGRRPPDRPARADRRATRGSPRWPPWPSSATRRACSVPPGWRTLPGKPCTTRGRGPTQVRSWYPPLCIGYDVAGAVPLLTGQLQLGSSWASAAPAGARVPAWPAGPGYLTRGWTTEPPRSAQNGTDREVSADGRLIRLLADVSAAHKCGTGQVHTRNAAMPDRQYVGRR